MLQRFSCCFMLLSLHDAFFCFALISCWTLSVLYFFILHSFQVSLFLCCTLYELHFFHFIKFLSSTFFMLYSFLVVLFPYCIFFMLHSFHVAPFFVLHCFYVLPFVHSFRVELFSCCTVLCYTFFMLKSFHAALFSCWSVFMLRLFVCFTPLILHFFSCCLLFHSVHVALFRHLAQQLY